MRRPFQLLLLLFVVLGVFYPTLFAESLSIDDNQMLLAYLNQPSLDWQALFFPTGGLYYYRPLVGLSFFFDAAALGGEFPLIHFENILIHAANTLLLFLLLHRLTTGKNDAKKTNLAPFLIAAFFGLHPLTAEPVNWISGRTDLLACFFVLLSFLLFLRNTGKKITLDLLAALAFLCGLWSKEVAIGLLPVVAFRCIQEAQGSLIKIWRPLALRLSPFLGALLLYGYLRTGGQISHDVGVMTALHGGHGAEAFPLAAKLLSAIKAIGFYSHKVLWPFPLNFAIVEINRPVALFCGLFSLAVFAVALLFFRRRLFMLGPVWFFCFLVPAVPIAINRMAWTPLAERYLYLPLIGLCLLLASLFARQKNQAIPACVLAILLLAFGTATAQRNIVWQKNLTLWEDVVHKSPSFAPGHNDYGLALLREGKRTEAEHHFRIAKQLTAATAKDNDNQDKPKMNLALMEEGLDQQIAALEDILRKEQTAAPRQRTITMLLSLYNRALLEEKGASRLWLAKMIPLYQELFTLEKNPYHLYRIGQLQLALGNREDARRSFETVCRTSNDYYTKPACTLAERLAQKSNKE